MDTLRGKLEISGGSTQKEISPWVGISLVGYQKREMLSDAAVFSRHTAFLQTATENRKVSDDRHYIITRAAESESRTEMESVGVERFG